MRASMEKQLSMDTANVVTTTSENSEVFAVNKGLIVPHPSMAGPLEALAKLKLTDSTVFTSVKTSSNLELYKSTASQNLPSTNLVHEKFAPSVAAVFAHHEQLEQNSVQPSEQTDDQLVSPTTQIKLKQEADLKNILGIDQPVRYPMPRGPTSQIRGPRAPLSNEPLFQPKEPLLQPRRPLPQPRGLLHPTGPLHQPTGLLPRPQSRGPLLHPRPNNIHIQTRGPIMSTGFNSKAPLLPLPSNYNDNNI